MGIQLPKALLFYEEYRKNLQANRVVGVRVTKQIELINTVVSERLGPKRSCFVIVIRSGVPQIS